MEPLVLPPSISGRELWTQRLVKIEIDPSSQHILSQLELPVLAERHVEQPIEVRRPFDALLVQGDDVISTETTEEEPEFQHHVLPSTLLEVSIVDTTDVITGEQHHR